MSKKAIRKETVTVEVGGNLYRVEWVIEGTLKLSHYIEFQDGNFKGKRKSDPHIYIPGQEEQMRSMIMQLVFEAINNYWP